MLQVIAAELSLDLGSKRASNKELLLAIAKAALLNEGLCENDVLDEDT